MTERRQIVDLSGIRAFLRAVEEQYEAVRSGRVVYFGTRRHGFTRNEALAARPDPDVQEVSDAQERSEGESA